MSMDKIKNVAELIVDTRKYTLIGTIDAESGGCAEIYLYQRDGIKYAVKVPKIKEEIKNYEEQFFTEVLFTVACTYPSIIKLAGWCISPPVNKDENYTHRLKIWLPYCSRKSLHDNIKELQDKPTELTIIILGTSMALDYIHTIGICHNDMKSRNILLDDDFLPLLADFGISNFYVNMTASSAQFSYPNSHKFEDKIKYTKDDIFALGTIILEIYGCGISDRTDKDMLLTSKEQYFNKLGDKKNDPMALLCKRMVSYEPAERPTAKEIVQSILNGNSIFRGTDMAKVEAYFHKIDSEAKANNPLANARIDPLALRRTTASSVRPGIEEPDQLFLMGVRMELGIGEPVNKWGAALCYLEAGPRAEQCLWRALSAFSKIPASLRENIEKGGVIERDEDYGQNCFGVPQIKIKDVYKAIFDNLIDEYKWNPVAMEQLGKIVENDDYRSMLMSVPAHMGIPAAAMWNANDVLKYPTEEAIAGAVKLLDMSGVIYGNQECIEMKEQLQCLIDMSKNDTNK